jgi:hypothetical protein
VRDGCCAIGSHSLIGAAVATLSTDGMVRRAGLAMQNMDISNEMNFWIVMKGAASDN